MHSINFRLNLAEFQIIAFPFTEYSLAAILIISRAADDQYSGKCIPAGGFDFFFLENGRLYLDS